MWAKGMDQLCKGIVKGILSRVICGVQHDTSSFKIIRSVNFILFFQTYTYKLHKSDYLFESLPTTGKYKTLLIVFHILRHGESIYKLTYCFIIMMIFSLEI